MTAPARLAAIDVHGHYGPYVRAEASAEINRFASASAAEVAERATHSGVRSTIVSPLAGLLPRGGADALTANNEAARTIAATPGLLQWVIVHPLQPETFHQAAEILQEPQCVGIKIHPEEHCYPICEQGEAIFQLASEHDAIVLAHSGDENSLPADFVPFADAHSNVRLILAHLGNGGGAAGDPALQVRAIQAGRADNLFVDTSSARSILPGLIEWAVQEIGSEKILFGTDTPLYFTAMQRARIDEADLDEADKRRILCENAERLFGDVVTKQQIRNKES